jgi:hypothetical protein
MERENPSSLNCDQMVEMAREKQHQVVKSLKLECFGSGTRGADRSVVAVKLL